MSKIRLSPSNFPPGSIPTSPFGKVKMQRPQVADPQKLEETDASDFEGTQETEQEINPPDDWLQPKVFKGGTPTQFTPDSFSENKG
jgi:hypothetical protein